MPKPRRRSLSFLDKYAEEERRPHRKRRARVPTPPEPVIISPVAQQALIRSSSNALTAAETDTNELDEALTTTSLPTALRGSGGFFRPDPLTERLNEMKRLTEYKLAVIGQVTVTRRAVEEVGALKRAQRQQYLDDLAFKRQVLEAEAHLKYSDAAAARRDDIAAAQARATIARFDAEVKQALHPPAPVPPTPPTPAIDPMPKDPRAQNKARVTAEIERLDIEQGNEIRRLTKVRPESEWSDDLKEQVVQIQNMYDDARRELREQLARCL